MLSKDDGFTLIELLIVVVIIGILASVAIPKFSASKQKTYLTVMKTDLRNLATIQEAYLHDNGTYYDGAIPGTLDYATSQGVSITLQGVTGAGWAATATHQATVETCAMFHGAAAPVAPATIEGQVDCS